MEKQVIIDRTWIIFGSLLIPINLVCLIGSGITRNPYELLWISHYSGLLGGIVLILRFKKPFFNGVYSFLFIFQLGSVLTHLINPLPHETYLDVFYWLNHVPHIIGFYVIIKKKITSQGVNVGFIFLLFMMALTAQILYVYGVEDLGINTLFRGYFLLNLALSVGWYIILLLIERKTSRELK